MDFAVDKSEFSTTSHVDFSSLLFLPRLLCVLFTHISPKSGVSRSFRSVFPHGFAGFWKLKAKLILYFCQKQYFPHARVIFHNCLKSVFVDKSRKNPRFQPTFPRFYSHSRVLISPLRVKISRKSHFSERERKFPSYFQRVTKSFSRENPAHFHFSEYFFRRMLYTYI